MSSPRDTAAVMAASRLEMADCFHKRSVAIGFQDIHQRLAALEEAMASCDRPSPLSEYIQDLSPTEMKVVQDYFSRVRSTMLDCLTQHQIPLVNRRISLRWMLQTGLACVGIAVDELGPEHLRGYGALDSERKATLRKIQQELNRCVDRLSAYVRQGAGQDRQAAIDGEPHRRNSQQSYIDPLPRAT